MIQLYDKEFKTNLGALYDVLECLVEEERNGVFELTLEYPCYSYLADKLQKENIILCNANDTLKDQKFRIYDTVRLMDNTIVVHARHISFDLLYDYIDNISIENQSCEYVLNQLFRNSNFSKHYKGYSDIINAQDYNISMANVIEAIGGKSGSVIDTFGTGAEILRDNENIHILNKRGYDNDVTIEYKKNLTGFELEEDASELITRILPYAIYTEEETNNEITVKGDYVDSPLIDNYSHPYIRHIDYSDKFDNEIPTTSKLKELAENEFENNKVDKPKQNFKLEFIPLSKCVGYEGLEDKISLCDTVTIKDTRYNINTKAKVIKTVFNVLKNRYESMELGEPKTSLGDIIGGESDATVGPQGPQGPQGPPGADGEIGDFPNSLPSTPIVTTKVYGFSNIEISWTFENKVYYQYEVYASKEADFTPNAFNLIHQGQTSTFMYQAKPNETWYFKVCAINTHGNRTSFGDAYATTVKIDDLSNYVGEMAIGDALIGELNLGRGWVGVLRGNYIDAKNLSVTDGNGKRTLDIDSYGNVSLDVNSLKIHSTTLTDWTNNKWNANWNEKTQTEFFNKITSNGAIKGIFMENGHLYINSSYLRGTIIEGMQLKTVEPSETGGVWIKKDGMQLGSTSLFYSNNNFKIEAKKNISISSLGDIHLMPSSYLNIDGRLNATQVTLGEGTDAYIKYSSFYSQWASGNLSTWGLKLSGAILLGTSGGNMHIINGSGSKGGLYATLYSSYSLAQEIYEQDKKVKATDIIESASVVNECVIPTSSYSVSKEVMNKYITYNDENQMYDMNINNTIALLWESIQELKEENRELRSILSKNKG